MLFLSCNSTRSSEGHGIFGVYLCLQPLGGCLLLSAWNNSPVPGILPGERDYWHLPKCQLCAGRAAGCCPRGCGDAALPGDAAVGCRMLLSAGQAQPPALSAQPLAPLGPGGEHWDPFQQRGVLQPIFGCCASSKFGLLLINTGAV